VQYKMAEERTGIADTIGSFALANTEAYDDGGDPPVGSSVLGIEPPFIDSDKLLVVVDVMSTVEIGT
jgi:hypothetical protein